MSRVVYCRWGSTLVSRARSIWARALFCVRSRALTWARESGSATESFTTTMISTSSLSSSLAVFSIWILSPSFWLLRRTWRVISLAIPSSVVSWREALVSCAAVSAKAVTGRAVRIIRTARASAQHRLIAVISFLL